MHPRDRGWAKFTIAALQPAATRRGGSSGIVVFGWCSFLNRLKNKGWRLIPSSLSSNLSGVLSKPCSTPRGNHRWRNFNKTPPGPIIFFVGSLSHAARLTDWDAAQSFCPTRGPPRCITTLTFWTLAAEQERWFLQIGVPIWGRTRRRSLGSALLLLFSSFLAPKF